MTTRPPQSSRTTPQTVEVIDPRWLLKAGAVAIAFALLCAYATVCVLFARGQWQLVLTPTRTVTASPAQAGLPFENVRFGVDETGTPQLAGWFIPADTPRASVALMLHAGDGNSGDNIPLAQNLHAAHMSVLLFDYRGYGTSGGQHPTQARMQIDVEAALDYLTRTRGLASTSIIPIGVGVGAALATALASQHHDLPAVVLLYPRGDMSAQVRADSRSAMAPVRWLFHEDFPLAAPLTKLTTPKLIITMEGAKQPLDRTSIADPKMTVELHTPADIAAEPARSLRRFLDTYAPASSQPLQLNP